MAPPYPRVSLRPNNSVTPVVEKCLICKVQNKEEDIIPLLTAVLLFQKPGQRYFHGALPFFNSMKLNLIA